MKLNYFKNSWVLKRPERKNASLEKFICHPLIRNCDGTTNHNVLIELGRTVLETEIFDVKSLKTRNIGNMRGRNAWKTKHADNSQFQLKAITF